VIQRADKTVQTGSVNTIQEGVRIGTKTGIRVGKQKLYADDEPDYSDGNGKPAGDVFRIGKHGQEADDLDAEFERY
jgi:hypothetical protein